MWTEVRMIKKRIYFVFKFAASLAAASFVVACDSGKPIQERDDPTVPEFLEVLESPSGGWNVVSISPFDGVRDTMPVEHPMDNIIVMSTSHIGFLDAIGCTSVISGVSGIDYTYTDKIRARSGKTEPRDSRRLEREVIDVGYEAAPNYEAIVKTKPDVVLTYSVSGAKSQFLTKMKSLGIRVFIVNEHLEGHPLSRASYVRLFGALTGKMAEADSIFNLVSSRYQSLADSVKSLEVKPRKVLVNIPYNDQWFVPSQENYLTRMVRDAGGVILGSKAGQAESGVISVEEAYSLSKEADCWMNVGWCRTAGDLAGINPLFPKFLENIRGNASKYGMDGTRTVFNDNARLNPKGGNDIWESGVARPDLVLRDLVSILHSNSDALIYYRPLLQ